MKGLFGTSWSVRCLLLAFFWTICLAGSANAVTAHHCQDAPTSMCECIDCDASDEGIVQGVATSLVMTLQASLATIPLLITQQNLSPIIFQPPEVACASAVLVRLRMAVCRQSFAVSEPKPTSSAERV